ncbi:MarR family winged helix-turn-helix transcriptional regulator [uncultured Arcanobacterium sp.]|uniref:MarR family winged helix-turn-helix transcriptional regulator n=1 Tax=uncultured Arcanobacterium sp. TaxID=487520 RepID=UPI002637BF1A|nr:MarR family transcriptional regulator [uncultured Arcanobacterium sp.]
MEGNKNDIQWLDAEEQKSWRALLQGISKFLAAANADLQQQEDLSLSEYEVLAYLSEAPGRQLRMSQLAQNLVHSRSRLTHTVHRLEKQEYVQRLQCADDKRGRNCILTEKGWQKIQSAAPVHVGSVRKYLIDSLTRKEFLELGRIFAQIMPDEKE